MALSGSWKSGFGLSRSQGTRARNLVLLQFRKVRRRSLERFHEAPQRLAVDAADTWEQTSIVTAVVVCRGMSSAGADARRVQARWSDVDGGD